MKAFTHNGKPVDLGYYINADEIAASLRKGDFSFAAYDLSFSIDAFTLFAQASGLLSDEFSADDLAKAYSVDNAGQVKLETPAVDERLAQLLARFLREELLRHGKRFSFETVFSHESNLDIMRRAAAAGYKVYLYFVATESPEINKYRVALRVLKGGHNVDPVKIEQRYYRALELLSEAVPLCHRTYFYDNSKDRIADIAWEPLVAQVSTTNGEQEFEQVGDSLPKWVETYYLKKL
ncbi:zeta toxin family protein [Cnuella takakiae]|uniref:zeta toxin family protein n=1 Tax=Cnuella takakiae TaxID=1302690 RepID=UPI001300ECF0|nr:zeta toxin family protein [Cnuella takakiae]